MKVSQFIALRSQKLATIVYAFLQKKTAYHELNDYTWDILNAWQDYCCDDKNPDSEQERVFWHLMYTLHFWDEQDLISNRLLRLEISDCAAFLSGKGHKPTGCVGPRP